MRDRFWSFIWMMWIKVFDFLDRLDKKNEDK